jgi:hypothetical protein
LRFEVSNLKLPAALADILPAWIALASLTTLPYIIALLRAPEGHVFTGVLSAYDDTFTYLAWIRQSADGALLMCDQFTSEPHGCDFFLPLWTLLGAVSRVTGASVALTFHAGRLVAGLLLLLVARSAALRVTESRRQTRYAVWLYAMSGGAGWLIYALNNQAALTSGAVTHGSADLYLPEAIAFRSVFAQVHLTAGAALTGAAIISLFASLTEGKATRALLAGLLATCLAVVHPYMVVVVCAVSAAAILLWPFIADRDDKGARLKRSFITAALFFISCAPGIAYLLYLNRSNVVLHELMRIMDTFSPAPWEYALGFGIVGPLAVAGFILLVKTGRASGRLLLVWAVVHALLLYAPVSFQRRFVEGLQMPLCIAASVAVFRLIDSIGEKRPLIMKRSGVALAAVIIVASLTNLGFFAGQIMAGDRTAKDPRRYVAADLVSAFEWMEENAERNSVVLSSYMTGNLLPSMTGLRAFLGHYGNTIRSHEKGQMVEAFYSGRMTDEAARALIAEHRVSFVIRGPFESDLSKDFIARPWLVPVHRAGSVEIYGVVNQ